MDILNYDKDDIAYWVQDSDLFHEQGLSLLGRKLNASMHTVSEKNSTSVFDIHIPLYGKEISDEKLEIAVQIMISTGFASP